MKKYRVICKQGNFTKQKTILCSDYSDIIDKIFIIFNSGEFDVKKISINFKCKIPVVFVELNGV